MSDRFEQPTDKHTAFIKRQHVFFAGTAGEEGFINVSSKGLDSLRVIDNSRVAWVNLTGSGNETAAHVLANGRMTLMFCSFEKQPLILRAYGIAKAVHPRDDEWSGLVDRFPDYLGTRQIFELKVELVQTSCGYAVPYYEMTGERPTLDKWAQKHGQQGIEQYWQEKNVESLNGEDTGIF